MRFNRHSELAGKHAFISASKYHWVNYTDDKFDTTFMNSMDAALGTRLHEFAAEAIRLRQKLSRSKKTLNAYINDAIGFGMEPEVVLFYSFNAFGTADAIKFDKGLLRIHDLKNGVTKASMTQLKVYAALFCLEYQIRPGEIEMELRIYQNDEVVVDHPSAPDIVPIMDKIVHFDKRIEQMKSEAL